MKKIKLPKKIRVGAYVFKVVEWDHKLALDKEAYGQFLPRQESIGIDPVLGGIMQLDTLIHEINHAIFFAYNIHDKDEEERTVHTISTAWAQVYRDNPKLLNYIVDIVNEEA